MGFGSPFDEITPRVCLAELSWVDVPRVRRMEFTWFYIQKIQIIKPWHLTSQRLQRLNGWIFSLVSFDGRIDGATWGRHLFEANRMAAFFGISPGCKFRAWSWRACIVDRIPCPLQKGRWFLVFRSHIDLQFELHVNVDVRDVAGSRITWIFSEGREILRTALPRFLGIPDYARDYGSLAFFCCVTLKNPF